MLITYPILSVWTLYGIVCQDYDQQFRPCPPEKGCGIGYLPASCRDMLSFTELGGFERSSLEGPSEGPRLNSLSWDKLYHWHVLHHSGCHVEFHWQTGQFKFLFRFKSSIRLYVPSLFRSVLVSCMVCFSYTYLEYRAYCLWATYANNAVCCAVSSQLACLRYHHNVQNGAKTRKKNQTKWRVLES